MMMMMMRVVLCDCDDDDRSDECGSMGVSTNCYSHADTPPTIATCHLLHHLLNTEIQFLPLWRNISRGRAASQLLEKCYGRSDNIAAALIILQPRNQNIAEEGKICDLPVVTL